MHTIGRITIAWAMLLASCGVENGQPRIEITDAWARSAAAGQGSTAAYFTIRNSGGEDRLVAVSTAAGDASLHSTSMDGGVMRMRHLDALDIGRHSTTALKPGGIHVMITGLERPLAPGTQLQLTLRFDRSGERQLIAEVRPRGSGAMH